MAFPARSFNIISFDTCYLLWNSTETAACVAQQGITLYAMGKAKGTTMGDGIPQRHIHSRISFLHQAATYLSTISAEARSTKHDATSSASFQDSCERSFGGSSRPQSRYLLNQLRGVSKKSQIRLGRDVKHSMCKRCQSLLIPCQTSVQDMENDSKGGKRPWADVFVVRCIKCQAVKRFPAIPTRKPLMTQRLAC